MKIVNRNTIFGQIYRWLNINLYRKQLKAKYYNEECILLPNE